MDGSHVSAFCLRGRQTAKLAAKGQPASRGPKRHIAGKTEMDGSHVLPKCQFAGVVPSHTGLSAKHGCHPQTKCQLRVLFCSLAIPL